MRTINSLRLLCCIIILNSFLYCNSQIIKSSDFHTDKHPRIFVTTEEREQILSKISTTQWAKDIFDRLKAEVDPIIAIHSNNPSYVISRMQMHWEPGKRYTHFYTEGNYVTRREGNAKYPTVRLTYGRAASNSVPLAPLDKIIPYGDGSLTKPISEKIGIVKIVESSLSVLSQLGQNIPYDTVPFTKTGLGTETTNRGFIHLAWKSSILYFLTGNKEYAKLSADILWNIVRGASQQEQLNPDWEMKKEGVCYNGYLSFETLGDTRHFATLPLAYDMIYDYLRNEYFQLKQFRKGIHGELWAPAHKEGKQWALDRFEILFKRFINNKLERGGGLQGNWNMNEQQSAMLYALALDDDKCYRDGKGRGYYVNKLVYGPTTKSHGAYLEVLRANIDNATGLWPEAPAGYGQGSIGQLVRFGYIYYKNGLDFLSKDTLLNKASFSMKQMLFPNGYVTNYGDASYSTMNTEQLELMMSYYSEKNDTDKVRKFAELMKYSSKRNLDNEFYYSLFFFLPKLPQFRNDSELARVSYSSVYSLVFGRNMANNPKDALAFTLMGFGKDTGHRHPNGMNMELYGRGYVLAPDQGVGQDYWGSDTHEYKMNVAAHNTVAPNGKGADNGMPQNLEILYAEPKVIDGGEVKNSISPNHQFVEAANHFYTQEIRAEQRRLLSIVRTSAHTGYFIDIFRSKVIDGENKFHDYIYHNMGIGSQVFGPLGKTLNLSNVPLDALSGKGYTYFQTLGSLKTDDAFSVDFHFGIDDTHMRMFMPEAKERTLYQLNSLFNHRYYEPCLKKAPVPAILVRQSGEAWNKPFVVVYEPYGNGAEAHIKSVHTENSAEIGSAVKLKVEHKENERIDYIISSDVPEKEIIYNGISFKGSYCVASFKEGSLISVYIGNGVSFSAENLKINTIGKKTFNALFEIKNGALSYNSDEEIKYTLSK